VPIDGHDILCFDYEQLEMRLLAAAAMDKDMLGVFERNWDIHMGNAALMFGLPYEDIEAAKKVEKKVKNGDLPPEAMTDYVKQCLKARFEAKSIGFGQQAA
jgi:predicted transglutaminase-like protease